MKNRSHRLLALAASATLAVSGFALAAEPNNQPANNQPGSVQARSTGQQVPPAGQQAAQQTDQEILQQIRQFTQDPKTACDKLFLLNTAIGSMFEVQLSQQAQQKAQSDQVKQLAQRFVQDHEKMNGQLRETAKTVGVQAPQSLPQMKQEELQVILSLSGREFDEKYVACMNAAHAHDVAEFEATSSLSQNAKVKQFASDNLPTLQQHYQAVRQVAQGMGISTQDAEATQAGARIHGSGEANTPAGTNGTGGAVPSSTAGTNKNETPAPPR